MSSPRGRATNEWALLRDRAAVEAAHEQISAWRRRVFESLEPAERDQAAALLSRLTKALEEQMP